MERTRQDAIASHGAEARCGEWPGAATRLPSLPVPKATSIEFQTRVHPSHPSYSSLDMDYTVTSWLTQQLLESMSSSDFLNEMHVGEYLALKMEARPVSPSPEAEEDG